MSLTQKRHLQNNNGLTAKVLIASGIIVAALVVVLIIYAFRAKEVIEKAFDIPTAPQALPFGVKPANYKPGEFFRHYDPLILGDTEVQVTAFSIEPAKLESLIFEYDELSKKLDSEIETDYLVVSLQVTNQSKTEKLNFTTWRPTTLERWDSSAVTLKDEFGNNYRRISFSTSDLAAGTKNDVLYPGQTIKDQIVFEIPVKNAKELRLALSANAFGKYGEFRFLLPVDKIKRQKKSFDLPESQLTQ